MDAIHKRIDDLSSKYGYASSSGYGTPDWVIAEKRNLGERYGVLYRQYYDLEAKANPSGSEFEYSGLVDLGAYDALRAQAAKARDMEAVAAAKTAKATQAWKDAQAQVAYAALLEATVNEALASAPKPTFVATGSPEAPESLFPPERRQMMEQALVEINKYADQTGGERVEASPENLAAINLIILNESGWNAGAQNKPTKGTPNKGLMQLIEPIFKTTSIPGHDNILNPTDNIIAGVRYAIKKYGSLQNVPGVQALANGQRYRPF